MDEVGPVRQKKKMRAESLYEDYVQNEDSKITIKPMVKGRAESLYQDYARNMDAQATAEPKNRDKKDFARNVDSQAIAEPKNKDKLMQKTIETKDLCDDFKEEQETRLRELRARCEQRQKRYSEAGTSDPMLSRHGTTRVYLHHNRSLMWCETPKAMSTSWGRVVFGLEGRDTSQISYVRVHIWMHDTFEFVAPTVFSMDSFNHVTRFEEYSKLIFVRDPFTRFLSAYLDKVELPGMKYHNLVKRIRQEVECNMTALVQNCYRDLERTLSQSAITNNPAGLMRVIKCYRLFFENSPSEIQESAGLREQLLQLLGRDINFLNEKLGYEMCNEQKVSVSATSDYVKLIYTCSTSVLMKSCAANLSSGAIPTFEQFTRYVLDARDSKYALDRHWSPVSINCAPCSIPYTHFLRFETMIRDVECSLRDIYPPSAYANLATPAIYSYDNGTLKATNSKLNPLASFKNKPIVNLKVKGGTIGALRARAQDYRRKSSEDFLKSHYSQLTPDLMQRLWEFYRGESELLGYDPEPDFGISKFKDLHDQSR